MFDFDTLDMSDRVLEDECGEIVVFWWDDEHEICGEAPSGYPATGGFDIHRVYPEEIAKCYEEAGREEFWDELTAYFPAVGHSTWSDPSCGDFDEVMERFVNADGWTVTPSNAAEVADQVYARAVDALTYDIPF